MAVNLQMAVGAQTEVITVVGETAAAINTSTQDIATTVSQTQIRELPTITRNPYDLVQLSGQAADDPQSARGTGYAINGARSASTNVLLDGSANNDEFRATVGQDVPLDGVQEFSVITSNFSAQYGRASGGIVNVATKSGTNQFQGTVYEFFRNDALATNTFDNKANEIEKGNFDRHQMGFSLGGPVQKDKIHFFTTLEYIRVRSTDTQISWVPTPEFIAASAAGRPRPSSRPTAEASTINGPVLTRGDVSAIVRHDGWAPSTACRPACPSSARWKRAADRRGRRQPAGPVPARWPPGLQPELVHPGLRPLRLPEPEDGAGHERLEPLRRLRHGLLNKNHNVLGSLTHVFSPTLHEPDEGRLRTGSTTTSRSTATGAADPLHEPDDRSRLQGYRIAFPGYLPVEPRQRDPLRRPAEAPASSTRTSTG